MSMIAWGSSCVNGWDADSNTSNTQMEYAADVAIANGGECLCDSVILQKKRFAGFDICNNLCLTLRSKIRSPNVINLNSVPHVCTWCRSCVHSKKEEVHAGLKQRPTELWSSQTKSQHNRR